MSQQAVRQPETPTHSRVTAFFLAFFLGNFGAHKFYLGSPLMGFVYMFFGTIGWLLIVPGLLVLIVSFLESLFYLTCKNDQEFCTNFVVQ